MSYKGTLLKDLPGIPAGSQFGAQDEVNGHGQKYFLSDHPKLGGCKIIGDPEWVKLEVDPDRCIDMKCPVCGETRGVLITTVVRAWADGYYYKPIVSFECICGYIKSLLK